ncbi:3-oxoacyl-ACP synthase [Hydrogenophaga borbori]|uniref:3-oxoacyl-ACP synthase n=1 Tax=Hydrogenophaga borbori TaxID=2294117 RepID=A0A372EN93_9BURK|nr:beta-ketoacyl synthase chain length factor [Hydrogenophaga borbori]RFP81129.1 3-oxoacyl-ACP synthase [Hydrogenophaga borbori]
MNQRPHAAPHTAVWLHGVSIIAPGLADWPQAAAVLRGEQAWAHAPSVLPPAQALPAAERRRASRVVRLALALGQRALDGQDPADIATVFTSSGADGHNCHALCEQLAGEDRAISPTRFHNSVHNAAAGYWGIATRSMAPSQVLCAHDASLGAGWIDAVGQLLDGAPEVLLVAYDSEYPEPLHACRPVPDAAGIALWLGTAPRERSLGTLHGALTRDPVNTLAAAPLDGLRRAFPALRGLPLLERIARGDDRPVVLDYLAPQHLRLRFTPRQP